MRAIVEEDRRHLCPTCDGIGNAEGKRSPLAMAMERTRVYVHVYPDALQAPAGVAEGKPHAITSFPSFSVNHFPLNGVPLRKLLPLIAKKSFGLG